MKLKLVVRRCIRASKKTTSIYYVEYFVDINNKSAVCACYTPYQLFITVSGIGIGLWQSVCLLLDFPPLGENYVYY
jgi:hypothetical protein